MDVFNDLHGVVRETDDIIDIVGNVYVVAIGMPFDPKIRVSLAGGVTHMVELLSKMFMEAGTRSLESIKAAIKDKLLSFKFPKFRTSNDVPFLSGLGIQIGRGAIGGTNLQTIHLHKKESQLDCLHTNYTSICFF